ncbi:MAG: sulfotransferase [Bacteroidota bacterium]
MKKYIHGSYGKSRWNGNARVFCLSMQKTGTTSVGDFFAHFGYPVARWKHSWENHWTKMWYDGNYEGIFDTKEFKHRQVFEDDPWWCPEFYKVLYHRFPNSKFILMVRDENKWFQSMLKHSKGKTLGNTRIHCKLYRREQEFYNHMENDPNFKPSTDFLDNLMSLEGMDEHYKSIYRIRNKEIQLFFENKDKNRFICLSLEDSEKWKKLGAFMGIEVPDGFEVHSNESSKRDQNK